jgi:hypothetical protein
MLGAKFTAVVCELSLISTVFEAMQAIFFNGFHTCTNVFVSFLFDQIMQQQLQKPEYIFVVSFQLQNQNKFNKHLHDNTHSSYNNSIKQTFNNSYLHVLE